LENRPTLKSLQEQPYSKYLDFYNYFNYQCSQRTQAGLGAGQFHDDCLIAELMTLYIENNMTLEGSRGEPGLLGETYIVRDQWTTVDLLSGFFNETFSWDFSDLGIKPVINKLVLEVAIRNELKKFRAYLDANPRADLFALKRHFYPEMMGYFGGFSLIARTEAYRSAMSCDFAVTCSADDPNCQHGLVCREGEANCGPEIQRECETADQALAFLVRREIDQLPHTTSIILEDLRNLSQNPAYLESQVIFDGLENAEILYQEIAEKMDSESILRWVKQADVCGGSESENPIEQLCQRIDESLAFPQNIRDKVLADALVASFIIWETQNLSRQVPEVVESPARLEHYPRLQSFLQSTESDLSAEFLQSFEQIRDHFLNYDPSGLIEQAPTTANTAQPNS
jgi:hypothetical protein